MVIGDTFLDYVRADDESADMDRVRNALCQLAGGLAALHAADKLHRDVKPSNVVVDESERLVLLADSASSSSWDSP